MKKACVAVIFAVSFHLTASAQSKPARLADLGWLAGCWESRNDQKDDLISEQWMKPAGGMMIGMGRTIRSGKAADWEFMRIEQKGADLIFFAKPKSNKEETPFKMVEMSAGKIVFENAAHDFPQRVIYHAAEGGLTARIEGTKNGKSMGMDFPMVRAKCDVLATAAAINAQSEGCPGKNGLTQAEQTEILTAHNTARSDHKLAALSWDCKLAETAQEWAALGVFKHRTGITFGESLYVSAKANTKANAAVLQWMLEKASWNNLTAECTAGKTCTHYTQVVWKKTDRMGCGINRNAQGKWKVLLVCNYYPAGNSGGPPF